MLYDNNADRFPVRKNPRLKNFDYTSCHYYFVTICTYQKKAVFGSTAKLSPIGEMAAECLQDIPRHFPGVTVDKWVVMPNHIHAIIILPGDDTNLSTVIGQYKSAVTKRVRGFCTEGTLWQVSFHDHVIRNQQDYERIWLYIEGNPSRWMEDCFYVSEPDCKTDLVGGVMTPPYESNRNRG